MRKVYDPGVLQFFSVNIPTFTGCTPDLKACDACVSSVFEHDALHALYLACVFMASCHGFHFGCSWLQSSTLAGLPGLADSAELALPSSSQLFSACHSAYSIPECDCTDADF